jgi:hypothetical protein
VLTCHYESAGRSYREKTNYEIPCILPFQNDIFEHSQQLPRPWVAIVTVAMDRPFTTPAIHFVVPALYERRDRCYRRIELTMAVTCGHLGVDSAARSTGVPANGNDSQVPYWIEKSEST